MTIKIHCVCGQKVSAPDSWAGKTGTCPHCGADILLATGTSSAWNIAPAAVEDGSMYSFFCTFCGKKLAVPEEAIDHALNCPHCRNRIQVPRKPPAPRKLSRTTGHSWSMNFPVNPIEIKSEPKPREQPEEEEEKPFQEIQIQPVTRSRKPRLAPRIRREPQ